MMGAAMAIPLYVRKPNGRYRLATYHEVMFVAFELSTNQGFTGEELTSADAVRHFLQIQLGPEPEEVFSVVFLDNRHRVLGFEKMFQGTIDGCSVHPRVIVRKALEYNAAAIILAHPHPSGIAEPSSADCQITSRLQEALALIDVRVLDHFIIGNDKPVSLVERGLL